MLNFCIFIFLAYALGSIVSMIVRPTEFFKVYKRRR